MDESYYKLGKSLAKGFIPFLPAELAAVTHTALQDTPSTWDAFAATWPAHVGALLAALLPAFLNWWKHRHKNRAPRRVRNTSVFGLLLAGLVAVGAVAGCTTIAPDGTRIEVDEQAIGIAMQVVDMYFLYQERERQADLEDAAREDERIAERMDRLYDLLGKEEAQSLIHGLIDGRKQAATDG